MCTTQILTCEMERFHLILLSLAGYEGTNCQININECASFPCQNGGYCTEPFVNMYQCQCVPGFEGIDCEINIDECSLYGLCEYYQICIDGINTFT